MKIYCKRATHQKLDNVALFFASTKKYQYRLKL